MVYVTHDQIEALALADRVAVMSDSRLQQVGTRHELYNAPANVFVADFIGEPPTNFFPVAMQVANGATRLRVAETDIVFDLAAERAARARASGRSSFIAGIRPQNLRLAGDGGHAFRASVLINEYLGERSILTLRAGPHQFRALVPPGTRVARGDTVTLAYAPRDVMVFDAETEELLA